MRDARIELGTERGGTCTLEASVRRRRKGEVLDPRLDPSAAEFDEFPLVVSPATVPWFKPGFGAGQECADGQPVACDGTPINKKRSALSVWLARRDGLGVEPHVLFVGLAFLWRRQLTIDIDAARLTIE